MILHSETTLNVFQHKNKTILCRIHVLPSPADTNGDAQNTCRSMTMDQWKLFDRELASWLDNNENTMYDGLVKYLGEFSLHPNFKVQIQKSNLSAESFQKFIKPNADNTCNIENNVNVIDCILEHSSNIKNDVLEPVGDLQTIKKETCDVKDTFSEHNDSLINPSRKNTKNIPPTPSIFEDEHNSTMPTGSANNFASPFDTYSPYTPIKRTRRFKSSDTIKTPGVHTFNLEKADKSSQTDNNDEVLKQESDLSNLLSSDRSFCQDENELIVLTNSTNRSLSPYSPKKEINLPTNSQQSDVIPETDEEFTTNSYKSARVRVNKRHHKNDDKQKQASVSPESIQNVPLHKHTSIESKKEKKLKVPKSKNMECDSEPVSNKKEKKHHNQNVKDLKENTVKNSKENKDANKSDRNKKRGTKSSSSSGDEFEKKTITAKEIIENIKEKSKESKTHRKVELKKRLNSSNSSNDLELETAESKAKKNKTEKHNENVNDCRRSSRRLLSANTSPLKEKLQTTSPPKKKSPSKSRRLFTEEQEISLGNKNTKSTKKRSPKLIDTDEDDDFDTKHSKHSDSNNNASKKISSFLTPKPNKNIKTHHMSASSSSSSSSAKKKRKRTDYEKEKEDLSKWLGKKKTKSSHKDNEKPESSKSKSLSKTDKSDKKYKSSKSVKDLRAKSPSPQTMDIVMPSKEEMEAIRIKHKLQREENEKMKAILEQINVPAPKEVHELSLKDLALVDLLATFPIYKSELDEIYQIHRKKDYVKGHEGINHCLVIGLIDQRIQLKMLEKLSDIYSNTKSTTQATLYANALLPEWIIRVFMEKHNFNRAEAIKQIEDQDAYKSYIEGQNENSLLFDD